MKFALSVATIVCYCFFSFLFAALCPALCLGYEVAGIYPAVCEVDVADTQSQCSAPCRSICEESGPIAVCSGSYGTQNSWRCAVDCPAPAKSPAIFEPSRLSKDILPIWPTEEIGQNIPMQTLRHGDTVKAMSSRHAEIIATTVLRI